MSEKGITSNPESMATVIEEFCLAVWEETGSVVEPVDWGVYDVLDPQDGLKRVTFDAELAQERDDCEFITFGSATFEALQKATHALGRIDTVALPWTHGKLPGMLIEKVQKLVHLAKCRPTRVINTREQTSAALQFTFHVTYQMADLIEELVPVVLDLSSLADITRYRDALGASLHDVSGAGSLDATQPRPVVSLYSLAQAYNRAVDVVRSVVVERIGEIKTDYAAHQQEELEQSRQYYAKTVKILQQQLHSATDAERAARFMEKISATEADWARRQDDIARAYEVNAEVRLDQVRLYWMPVIRVYAEAQQRTVMLPITFDYYPWARSWAVVVCSRCYQPSTELWYHPDGWYCGCG